METEKVIIDTVNSVITNLAEQESIEPKTLGIRVDLENEKAKPIYGLFEKAKFIRRTTVKKLAKAGGAGAFSGILGMSIRKIVKSVFKYGMEQYQASETKELFLLIHLKAEDDNSSLIPAIALYKQGIATETILLSDILSGE